MCEPQDPWAVLSLSALCFPAVFVSKLTLQSTGFLTKLRKKQRDLSLGSNRVKKIKKYTSSHQQAATKHQQVFRLKAQSKGCAQCLVVMSLYPEIGG